MRSEKELAIILIKINLLEVPFHLLSFFVVFSLFVFFSSLKTIDVEYLEISDLIYINPVEDLMPIVLENSQYETTVTDNGLKHNISYNLALLQKKVRGLSCLFNYCYYMFLESCLFILDGTFSPDLCLLKLLSSLLIFGLSIFRLLKVPLFLFIAGY